MDGKIRGRVHVSSVNMTCFFKIFEEFCINNLVIEVFISKP